MNNNTDEVSNYFTEDVLTQMREMSEKDMTDLLKAMEGTPLWFAILKYNQSKIEGIKNFFLVADPLNGVVQIARAQGGITGVLDLQDHVIRLNTKSKKSIDPKYKEEQKKNDLGGAYGVI